MGLHDRIKCPSCGNEEADYFYDSHDREETIECDKCDYHTSRTLPLEFEIARKSMHLNCS